MSPRAPVLAYTVTKDLILTAYVIWAVYVGYISLQIPSNMLIQYTGRPSIFIPACVFVWGGISTSTGAVKSFGPALVVSLSGH